MKLLSRRTPPGNYLIEPDGRIGVLDFGMVGVLNQDDRLNPHASISRLFVRIATPS